MNRLTNRFDKLLHYDNNEVSHYNCSSYIKVLEKLGNLEDLEEELGIDLVTLFKALKNGIYKKDEDLYFEATLRIYNGEYYLCQPYDDKLLHKVYLKDYGKSWALTREELENVN